MALELVSQRSEFAPANVDEIRVAPGSVEQVDLDEVLGGSAGKDSLAVRLESSAPVTASVGGTRDGSRLHAVAGTLLDDRGAAVLPEGPKRVVLTGQPGLGTARVVARDRDGKVVTDTKLELDPAGASWSTCPQRRRWSWSVWTGPRRSPPSSCVGLAPRWCRWCRCR